jgi:AraC-like DNA-binding protein
MDYIVDRMDNFNIHLEPIPRLLPAGITVQSLGYMPRKGDRVHSSFDTFNFSFILSGGGTYESRGKTWEVEGPCVITQWPGEPASYGPSGQWSTWEELYIIIPARQLAVLRERRLALERRPVWQVRRATPMLDQWRLLQELLPNARESGVVDRIDRVCEMMVVESRLGELRPPISRDEAVIREIRNHVRSNPVLRHDFDELAQAHGLSPATFRRHWARYVPVPPARYLMELRMRDACRLLVETDATVAEIGAALGFDDPLYFSRRFSVRLGIPAPEYRRRHAVQK